MQKTLSARIRARLRSDWAYVALLSVCTAFCLTSGICFIAAGEARNALLMLAFAFFPALLVILEAALRMRLPTLFVALCMVMPVGNLLGSCFDLYSAIPFFDDILHTVSGFVFACLGFGFLSRLIGRPHDAKTFAGCLLCGFAFSMAVAAIWEMIEYVGTEIGGMDMQEDTVITGFGSYLLSGTHSEIVSVEGITQTVIYYGDGESLVINGYLDIGLIDTVCDMFVCLIGDIVFVAVTCVVWAADRSLLDVYIPHAAGEEASDAAVGADDAAEAV